MNAGDLITTDIVYQLWHQFLQDEAAKSQTLPIVEPNAPLLANNNSTLEDVDSENIYNEKPLLT